MLRTWHLQNFKSVLSETKLDLGQLTVFTGANSAGKSTIIQSMLLATQSIQSSVVPRAIILNGNMIRLGTFSDIVSSADKTKNVKIGFTLAVDKSDIAAARVPSHTPVRYLRRLTIDYVTCRFSFSTQPGPNDPADSILELQPSLYESMVSVTYTDKSEEKTDDFYVKRSTKSFEERLAEIEVSPDELTTDQVESLRYEVSATGAGGRRRRTEGLNVEASKVGALMQHFLPKAAAIKFDEVEAEVASQWSMLAQPSYAYSRPVFDDKFVVSEQIALLTIETLERVLGSDAPGEKLSNHPRAVITEHLDAFRETWSLVSILNMYRHLVSSDQSRVSQAFVANEEKFKSLLRDRRSNQNGLDIEFVGEKVGSAVDYIQVFFSRFVRYLGPLRDEPKPLYPITGASDTADVGFRGEHTAAVLEVHKDTPVAYVPSESITSETGQSAVATTSLAKAVEDWLSYMGVGRQFSTSDYGKLGHGLRVKSIGSDLEHDLTQVGVGVSQVLPILVLALLADAGSTLIFEQPELHLHPRVQTRLADFLVSMTLLGKQCIVETHSEYLINRLRLRAATDRGAHVSDAVVIYFVEKKLDNSEYKPLRIDELGGLDSWPEGFFDESEHGTRELLRRGLAKRRRLKTQP